MKLNKGGLFFGGLFFLAGAFFFYLFVASNIFESIAMRNWVAMPATLQSAALDSYQKQNDSGGSTTMYRVKINYSYRFQYATYSGSRLSIDNYSSSNYQEHADQLSEIRQQAKQDNFRIWVNPEDPAESIYDRALSWRYMIGMSFFTSIFMCIGIGVILASRKDESDIEELTADKPWMGLKKWASPTIHSDAIAYLNIALFASILCSLIVGLIITFIVGRGLIANTVSIVLLIPLFFVYRWYWRKRRQWQFFGPVPLQLGRHPGVIGGVVSGKIMVPTAWSAGDTYQIELKCIHYRRVRRSNGTRLDSNEIWSEKKSADVQATSSGTELTFEFHVPADKPESSTGANSYYTWKLEVTSSLKGFDFERAYEVPVFKTQDSKTIEDELLDAPLDQKAISQIDERLAVVRNFDTLSFYVPQRKLLNPLTLISGIFLLIGFLLLSLAGELLFGFAWTVFSIFMLGFALVHAGSNNYVRVSQDFIEVDAYLFSFLIKQIRIPTNEIVSVEVKKTSSSSRNGKLISEKYGLLINPIKGKAFSIGGDFPSQKSAYHFKQEVERTSGLA